MCLLLRGLENSNLHVEGCANTSQYIQLLTVRSHVLIFEFQIVRNHTMGTWSTHCFCMSIPTHDLGRHCAQEIVDRCNDRGLAHT